VADNREPSAESASGAKHTLPQIGLLLILLVRGVLLWIVVPISIGWWLLATPIDALTGRPHVRLAQTIGWADLNLIALLTLGRLVPFVSWSQASKVEHRVSLVDPA
jgi:hypothetical protein